MEQLAGLREELRQLERPEWGRWVAGVAHGIACYLGVDVVVVRFAFVALTVMGGVGVPLYLAAWLLIPAEGAEESLAEHLLSHAGDRPCHLHGEEGGGAHWYDPSSGGAHWYDPSSGGPEGHEHGSGEPTSTKGGTDAA